MKRIVVLVSGGGTNLQALIDSIESGNITNAIIVGVVSSKDGVYAIERAKKHNIPAITVQKSTFSSDEQYKEALTQTIEALKPDLIVLAGFLSILSEDICKKFANRIINIHPALIPSFCGKGYYGLRVHQAVLDHGVKVTGATVHFVNEVVDGGAIILQKSVEVKQNDNAEILQKRVMEEAEWDILPRAVNLFCNDKIKICGKTTKILE